MPSVGVVDGEAHVVVDPGHVEAHATKFSTFVLPDWPGFSARNHPSDPTATGVWQSATPQPATCTYASQTTKLRSSGTSHEFSPSPNKMSAETPNAMAIASIGWLSSSSTSASLDRSLTFAPFVCRYRTDLRTLRQSSPNRASDEVHSSLGTECVPCRQAESVRLPRRGHECADAYVSR